MHRHYSDQAQGFSAHPHAPHAANPRGLTLAQPRGTVSMPTSPIQTHTYPWSEGPQTAQAYFNIPAEPESYDPSPPAQAYYEPNFLDGPSLLGAARALSPGGEAEPPRKKRAQVRIACTHCQKACKKCSNTRPCDRCVKYGLKDCVDSSRKPRKTGVKRGPYKRRASKYPDDLSSSLSLSSSPLPPGADQSDPNHRYYHSHPHPHPHMHQHQHQHQHQLQHNLHQAAHIVNGNGSPQLHSHAHPHQHGHPGLPPSPGHPTLPGPADPSAVPGGPVWDPRRSSGYSYQAEARPNGLEGYPPPPRSSLGGVFAAALNGPRWINGERMVASPSQRPHHDITADLNMSAGGTDTPGVMYPAPIGSFPLSLGLPPRSGSTQGGMADPFSRAVSPLGARPVVAHHLISPPNELSNSGSGQGPSQTMSGDMTINVVDPLLSSFGFDPSLVSADPPNGSGCVSAPPELTTYGLQSMLSGPYNFSQAVSAPVSPRSSSITWPDVRPAPRSSSTEPPSTAAQVPQPMFGMSMSHAGRTSGYASPAMVALKRVRKPSLKTLMSNTTSANNSPLTSPMLAPLATLAESPTLFDQPMNVEMEGWLDGHDARPLSEAEEGRKEDQSPARTGDLSFGGMLEIGFSS